MHIYFAAAISANNNNTEQYQALLKELEKYGDLTNKENYNDDQNLNPEEICDRMEQQLSKSNVMIADINNPSHGVGREIAYAQFEKKIPVLCLYDVNVTPSPVLEWNVDIDIFPYETMEDIQKILKTYFTKRL